MCHELRAREIVSLEESALLSQLRRCANYAINNLLSLCASCLGFCVPLYVRSRVCVCMCVCNSIMLFVFLCIILKRVQRRGVLVCEVLNYYVFYVFMNM